MPQAQSQRFEFYRAALIGCQLRQAICNGVILENWALVIAEIAFIESFNAIGGNPRNLIWSECLNLLWR
jgi:hypothetical protein